MSIFFLKFCHGFDYFDYFFWLFFDFVSSDSVCNHTCDEQIGLPLRGRPILLITRMIIDNSALLPLLIRKQSVEMHVLKAVLSLRIFLFVRNTTSN